MLKSCRMEASTLLPLQEVLRTAGTDVPIGIQPTAKTNFYTSRLEAIRRTLTFETVNTFLIFY